MARAIDDLERQIRALPAKDKAELLDRLLSEATVPKEEVEALARELTAAVALTSRSLDSAVARLDRLDADLERGRREVRAAVLEAGETWPFALLSSNDTKH